MFSALAKGHPPQRSNTAGQSKVHYEDGRASQEFYSHEENDKYFVTHVMPPAGVPSMFNPPLHIHSFQVETFTIRKGKGNFFLSTKSRIPDKNKPIVKNAGEDIIIPVRAYHRFESADPNSELIVDIALDPDTRDIEHRFFRNFFGYLDDCRKAKLEPSLFQILRFLYDVSGPLAIPIPIPFMPPSVGVAASWAFCWFGGVVVGEWLLGYKGGYDEYYKKGAE